jgi:hypothetical protein
MKRRVSISRPSIAKLLTKMVPTGRSQSPSGRTWMVVPSGMANQRALSAPSDHRGELTS